MPLASSSLQPSISRLNSPQINLNPGNQFTDNKDTIQYSKEIEEDVEKCIQGLFKLNSLSAEDFINILSKVIISTELTWTIFIKHDSFLFTA